MTIDSFAKQLITYAKTKLPDGYRDASFTVVHNAKPGNVSVTGIVIRKPDRDVAPCFYIDALYQQSQEGIDLPALAGSFAKNVLEYEPMPDFQTECVTDFEKAKDYLVSRLIDIRPSHNDGYLEGHPVKRLGDTDIGIICELDMSQFTEEDCCITVTDALVESWGVTQDDIYAYAARNSPNLRPLQLCSLSDICNECLDAETEPDSPATDMLILTNTCKYHGANAVLYPEAQEELRSRFPDGYYVLPSSIHETIIVPKNSGTPKQLLEMVTKINKTQVSLEDRLADDVFVIRDGALVSAVQ